VVKTIIGVSVTLVAYILINPPNRGGGVLNAPTVQAENTESKEERRKKNSGEIVEEIEVIPSASTITKRKGKNIC